MPRPPRISAWPSFACPGLCDDVKGATAPRIAFQEARVFSPDHNPIFQKCRNLLLSPGEFLKKRLPHVLSRESCISSTFENSALSAPERPWPLPERSRQPLVDPFSFNCPTIRQHLRKCRPRSPRPSRLCLQASTSRHRPQTHRQPPASMAAPAQPPIPAPATMTAALRPAHRFRRRSATRWTLPELLSAAGASATRSLPMQSHSM